MQGQLKVEFGGIYLIVGLDGVRLLCHLVFQLVDLIFLLCELVPKVSYLLLNSCILGSLLHIKIV